MKQLEDLKRNKNHMKKFLSLSILTLIHFITAAKRSPSKRSYEVIGLPEGDEISSSLETAIPLLIIGFLISYFFMWSKRAQKRKNDKTTNIGCLGIIIMGVGVFFLFPLLAWVEFIFVNILSIGFAIFVIMIIIYFIYKLFVKK